MKKMLLGLVAMVALFSFAGSALADDAPADGEKKPAKKGKGKKKEEKKDEAPAK